MLNCRCYSTVGFFAPKAGYAASGKYSMQADELKTLIKELHRNDIKVILDVVFNHTAEGNEHGPYISFKSLDNKIYYILTPDGYYYNFSGCGNTLNCNNPVVRNLILDCLRYWVGTYHVDGFRFDLAAILGRNQDGSPMSNSPLLESLAHDPILKDSILIAEAWDAGGLAESFAEESPVRKIFTTDIGAAPTAATTITVGIAVGKAISICRLSLLPGQ